MACDMWLMACDMWLMAFDMWLMACDMWLMACDMWLMACDMWLGLMACGMWHMAYGMWYVAYFGPTVINNLGSVPRYIFMNNFEDYALNSATLNNQKYKKWFWHRSSYPC